MWRKFLASAVLAGMVFGITSSARAQTKGERIASAMSAAPVSIAKNATIKDWPDKNGAMITLREGSNGWTCLPSHPKTRTITNDAMCADATFMEFMGDLMGSKPVGVKNVGYSYMLSANDWESNTDPMATKEAPDNQWHHLHGHVMVVYPDKALLAGLPVRPSLNGPYVMWADTPYAHVMMPVK
jgi:hypothetical protein